jgi:HrpA-like RNA helicase
MSITEQRNISKLSNKALITNIGILDPEGRNHNPLTNNPYSPEYVKNALEYDNAWARLPVYSSAQELIKLVNNNQVILAISGTGSGKSVLLPKFALHTTGYQGRIVITNPKKLATKSNAEYAAKHLDVDVGNYVGYQYKDSGSHSTEETRLLFTTDGTLVARLNADPLLLDFDIIIIDEAHERTVNIDILLLRIKNILLQRPKLKLIIMSATINSDLFMNYYPITKFKFAFKDLGSFPNYEIKEEFLATALKTPVDDYVTAGVDVIYKILAEDKPGDIIMFVTGKGEGVKACSELESRIRDLKLKPFCVQLASDVVDRERNEALEENLYKNRNNGPYSRKIVMTTNIAESSVTIKGAVHIIENGLANNEGYDAERNMYKLDKSRITQASAIQRKGRVGRTQIGYCYYLYTKKEFEAMEKFPVPEIRYADFTLHLLNFLGLSYINNIGELQEILRQMIEPPDVKAVNSAINILTAVGAITNEVDVNTRAITPLGIKLNSFSIIPIEMRLALLFGYKYQCSHEIADICALIYHSNNQVDMIFKRYKPTSKDKYLDRQNHMKYQSIRKKFQHKYGDHHTILNIYTKYLEYASANKDVKAWCDANHIRVNTLKRVKNTSKNIMRSLNNITNDIEIISSAKLMIPIDDKILLALMMGHFINLSKQSGNLYANCFYTVSTTANQDMSSFHSSKSRDKYIFYSTLQSNNGRKKFIYISSLPDKFLKVLPQQYSKYIQDCFKETNPDKSDKSSKFRKKTKGKQQYRNRKR